MYILTYTYSCICIKICVWIICGNSLKNIKNFFSNFKQFFYKVEISIKNMEYSFVEAYNSCVNLK